MTDLLPLVVAVPLAGAAVSAIWHRHLSVQRAIGVAAVGFVAISSLMLAVEVSRSGPVSVALGGWEPPVGITLRSDLLSGLMLAAASVIVLAVLLYSISQLGRDVLDWWFHTKYLVLVAGVALALTTSDLFNLFVGFEMTLIASYTLLTVRSGPRQVRSTMTYVVVNLVASLLFLATVSVAYAGTGTLDLLDMAARLDELDPALSDVLGAMTLVVFGIKAALFPLFMWLPDSYPTAPSPVTALFAGLLTKVGVYAIYRTQTLFGAETNDWLLGIAALTMLFGVVGAMAQRDVKRILSFHIVSQIGYMIMGLGLLSVVGVAAGIAYILNQIIVKTGLFLVAGEIEAENGDAALDAGGGLASRRPGLAASFAILAASLAGIPPTGGFVLKYALMREGIVLEHGLVVGVAVLVSFLTLFSMMKIWAGVFWGEPVGKGAGARRGMRVVTAAVGAVSVAVAIWAGPLFRISVQAADDLLEPGTIASEEIRS